MKLMFLLFFDNVKSEQERLDYQWLLGFGLDDDLPDHSVRSKARTRCVQSCNSGSPQRLEL